MSKVYFLFSIHYALIDFRLSLLNGEAENNIFGFTPSPQLSIAT
jgi:hypothetical protein